MTNQSEMLLNLSADYYYGDQEYKMKASEWTRRADVDSENEYDERRARDIYQSVPGGSRHLKHGVSVYTWH